MSEGEQLPGPILNDRSGTLKPGRSVSQSSS